MLPIHVNVWMEDGLDTIRALVETPNDKLGGYVQFLVLIAFAFVVATLIENNYSFTGWPYLLRPFPVATLAMGLLRYIVARLLRRNDNLIQK